MDRAMSRADRIVIAIALVVVVWQFLSALLPVLMVGFYLWATGV